jgi:hypothetical protein
MSDEQKRRKTSSVRHTRAIQRDRSKHPSGPAPDEEVQSRLEELIQPKLYTQARIYADLGLRECCAAHPHSDPAADDGLRAQPDLASNCILLIDQ